MSMCRLGVLLSGRGSNFGAIRSEIADGSLPDAEIALVVSNHDDAPGLAFARQHALPTVALDKQDYPSREAFDAAIAEMLRAHQVDLVILAGYDRIISVPLLAAFPDRILNIHPSLLPAYGGKNMVGLKVHAAVLENREAESGCSVHIVTDTVDGGPVLGQSRVPVLPEDTPETLAARILAEEHRLYPQVIREWIARHWMQREEANSHEPRISV
jgi:phosphoribosylglycinamide formyltransferase-1